MRLESPDPSVPPAIDPALPAGERYVDRMPTGLRIARAVGAAAPPARRRAVHGAGESRRFLRRHGVDRLRVVDASVRPSPPVVKADAAVLATAGQEAGATGTAA